jgi:hypothetical protein
MIDHDTPASGSVTRRKRVSLDLVDLILPRLAGADRGLDRLDLVNVYDIVATVSAYAIHGRFLERDAATEPC